MNNFYNIVLFFIFMNVAIANQDIGCFLTTALANNDDYRLSLHIKNRLEKGRFPEIVDNYLKQKGYTVDFIFSFTTIGSVENPYISNYTVYKDRIKGLRIYYDYNSKIIKYKFIENTISENLTREIYEKLSKIPLYKKSLFDVMANDSKKPIIIFNCNNKDNSKTFSTVIQPKTFFSKEDNDEDRLLALRTYILSLVGLDAVESDLSNISEFSLISKLRDNSILKYDDIDNAINLYLKGKHTCGLDKSIWRYIALSNNELDKYLLLWLFHIDRIFKSKNKQTDAYLLQECFVEYIKQLDCNKNMLHKYILYKYYFACGDREKAQNLLISLKKLKISERLLSP